MIKGRLIFRQLFDHASYTYTYLLACARSMEGVLIDPVIEQVDRDVKVARELGVQLVYAGNTHAHADHVTGTAELGKLVRHCKSFIARSSSAKADILLDDGAEIKFGNVTLKALSTPGHTDGCMTFVCHDARAAFTGDALLIRSCGRTDFQAGNAGRLYESVHSKILSLPADYLLYPGHDYNGMTVTSVREEHEHNPRLTLSKEKFVELMNNLKLNKPKQIEKAVPANMVNGDVSQMDDALAKRVKETAVIH